MTTVYIPRPIRTVEDAEKLPEGTIAYQDRKKKAREVAVKVLDAWGDMPPMWAVNGLYRGCADVVGWTALVPVEATEVYGARDKAGAVSRADAGTADPRAQLEKHIAERRALGHPYTLVSRLFTPWEAVEEA